MFQGPFQAKRLPRIRDLENVKAYLRQNPFEIMVSEEKNMGEYKWLYIRDEKNIKEGKA